MTHTIISGNTASGGPGGDSTGADSGDGGDVLTGAIGGGQVTVTGSMISGNVATGGAGGTGALVAGGGEFTVGGGIADFSTDTVGLYSGTVVGNTANASTTTSMYGANLGMYTLGFAKIIEQNTVFATPSTGAANCGAVSGATTTDSGHNFEDTNPSTCGLPGHDHRHERHEHEHEHEHEDALVHDRQVSRARSRPVGRRARSRTALPRGLTMTREPPWSSG